MRNIKKSALCCCTPIALIIGSMSMNILATEVDTEISIDEGEVSIAARQAKLSDILVELGNQADVAVIDADTIDGTFDGEVTGTSVEAVLNQLGVNTILVWDNSDGDRTLKEIIVLSVSEEGSQFLPSGDTDPVAAATGNQAVTQKAPVLDANAVLQEVPTAVIPSATTPGNGVNNAEAPATEDASGSQSSPGFAASIDPNSATINSSQ